MRIRRCLPCGQRRCRVARRIWLCHGKSHSPKRFAHPGALSARRRTQSPSWRKCAPFLWRMQRIHPPPAPINGAESIAPPLQRWGILPLPSRGENGGLCPHPPKGPIPWESLWGKRQSSPHHPPSPKRRRRQAPARGLAAVDSRFRRKRNENAERPPPTRGAGVQDVDKVNRLAER